MTCIVVDIGNTGTSIALAEDGRIRRRVNVPTASTTAKSARAAVARATRGHKPENSAVCSVVPSATRLWDSALTRTVSRKPFRISHKSRMDIRVSYPRPSTIGPDRLANACGAFVRYGAPVIVADFGTALTFDVVSADNTYIGGVITPGLPLMTDYLAEKTALLPKVRLPGKVDRIGRSTRGAIMIGARIGYRGIVRETVRYLKKNLNLKKVRLVATGGYARWALEGLDMPFEFDDNLTLFGISRICELNK